MLALEAPLDLDDPGNRLPQNEVFITSQETVNSAPNRKPASFQPPADTIPEENRPYLPGTTTTIERTQYDLEDFRDQEEGSNLNGSNADRGNAKGSPHGGPQGGSAEMEEEAEEEYLANLNIVKSNADKTVQYQIKRAKNDGEDDGEGADAGNFGKGLPQTQSQLDMLSVDSADYQIKEYVADLFEN